MERWHLKGLVLVRALLCWLLEVPETQGVLQDPDDE